MIAASIAANPVAADLYEREERPAQTDPLLWLSSRLRVLKPYSYHIMLMALIPTAFWLDVHSTSIIQQHLLGVGAWLILIFCTRFSPRAERRQVWTMVGVATCVEIWSSLVWGIYRYRLGNVPMFVPPGHGLVYLFALRAARTPLMLNHAKAAKMAAITGASAWAVFGLTLEPLLLGRLDLSGALFWPVFIWFMRKPSAPIYAAAFFVTSVLELWGTGFGNWAWQVYAPVSHIPTGNPPSVISAGYCIMDFTSIWIAGLLPTGGILSRLRGRLSLPRLNPAVPEVAQS